MTVRSSATDGMTSRGQSYADVSGALLFNERKTDTMRRYAIIAAMLLGIVACATFIPSKGRVFVVEAQTLPVTKTVAWDANPVSDAVIDYTVTQQLGTNPVTTVATTTSLASPIAFNTVGNYQVCVSARNTWGSGPTSCIGVTVQTPNKPSNVRLQ